MLKNFETIFNADFPRVCVDFETFDKWRRSRCRKKFVLVPKCLYYAKNWLDFGLPSFWTFSKKFRNSHFFMDILRLCHNICIKERLAKFSLFSPFVLINVEKSFSSMIFLCLSVQITITTIVQEEKVLSDVFPKNWLYFLHFSFKISGRKIKKIRNKSL